MPAARESKGDWLEDLDPELVGVIAFAAITGVGGWRHSLVLALFGTLGLVASALLLLWQRECLVRLTYRRDLPQHRAEFGEEIELECELVNDKILPLPWVRVTDLVPEGLGFAGVTLREANAEHGRMLLQGFSLLPFQRATRRIAITCERRGRHVFGPSELRSGDPLGLRQRVESRGESEELLVYPKIFALAPPALAARTPIGEERARSVLLADPSRIAGMRAYRPGDPLRHVDWRATARSGDLLVRDFEATTTPRIAIFFDLPGGSDPEVVEQQEFSLSLAASLLAHYFLRGQPVGLYGPGTAEGGPIASDPSSAPEALSQMLELLALCRPDPRASLAEVLGAEAPRLRRQALVLVIASRFDTRLQSAIASCRRRAPVTALFVEGEGALEPAPSSLDALWRVARPTAWTRVAELHVVH